MKKYNKQGIRLIDDQLLVLPDEVKDTYDTASGIKIYKPRDLDGKDQRMEEAAQTKAVIIDVSPKAYLDLDDADRPEVGERIFMQRHAGEFFKGADGIEYRIICEGEVNCFINF